MKNIFICLVSFLFHTLLYAQIEEINNYKFVYDSIKKANIYYEKINTNTDDFFDSSHWRLIDNKIIKSSKKIFFISNGLIVEEIEVLKSENDKEKVFYKRDSLGYLINKIYCLGKSLRKVEFYDDNKLMKIFMINKYGERSETFFEYYDWGYEEQVYYNYNVKKYEVIFDYSTQELISRKLVGNTDVKKESIAINSQGQYYWVFDDNESDNFMAEFCNYCKA